MEFRILGSLEVIADGVPLRLGGRRQRELLAYLLVHAGMPIATDRIIEDLWGDARPAQAENVFRVLVSLLHAALKPVENVSTAGGYVLELRGCQVDARRFEQLVVEGRDALLAGDADAAASKLHGASFGRAVELCRRHAYREGAAVTFVGLAELTLRDGEPVMAARLLGAAGAQLDTAGAVLESGELVVRDRTVTQLEDVLGAAAAEVARSEGAELTLDQALDEAAAQASRARVAAPGEP